MFCMLVAGGWVHPTSACTAPPATRTTAHSLPCPAPEHGSLGSHPDRCTSGVGSATSHTPLTHDPVSSVSAIRTIRGGSEEPETNVTDLPLPPAYDAFNGTTDNDDVAMDDGRFGHSAIGASDVSAKRTLSSESENSIHATPSWNEPTKKKRRSLLSRPSRSHSTTTEEKLAFLDRVALVTSSLLRKESSEATLETGHGTQDWDAITPQSDLTLPGRHFHIVTTAALPWFTGTAVNPLLRAAYLHEKTRQLNTPANHSTNAVSESWVTLVIPWLELVEDQEEVYGRVFRVPQEQETYIREWLRLEAGLPDAACPQSGLRMLFYPARYHSGLGSVFAMGDIMEHMDPARMDVCILEEPEHCNWYRAPGEGWTKRFNYVVGIVHTNYKEYASAHYSGLWTAPALALMSSAMVRAYCHKVIKLSDALQTYAPEKEETSNVHGVRDDFLKEGRRRASTYANDTMALDEVPSETTVYFIGKLLWTKGLDILLELEDDYKQYTGQYFSIDVYGSGPDQKDIMRAYLGRRKRSSEPESKEENVVLETTVSVADDLPASVVDELEDVSVTNVASTESATTEAIASLEALQIKAKEKLSQFKKTINAVEIPKSLHELRRQPIPATFPGRVDHAILTEQYKVFVNPSVSEVLCTTTAEALAMGKFVIIPVHPSNTFFLRFPNCLGYRNRFEFVANLRWALTHEPDPLSPELATTFSWEAATDRFIQASAISWKNAAERERLGKSKLDDRIAWLHNEIGKGATGDMLRMFFGAGPASRQVQYQTLQRDSGITEVSSGKAGDSDVDDDENEDTDCEDDGLSSKFRRSSFAEAIRATINDLSSFMQ